MLEMKDDCHGNVIGISICLYNSNMTESSDVFNLTIGEIKVSLLFVNKYYLKAFLC